LEKAGDKQVIKNLNYKIGSRPAEFAPALGTGLATVLLFVVIVVAGLMIKFGLVVKHRESWRLIHVGLSLSLFIVQYSRSQPSGNMERL
jgi:hypothetical protein